MYGCNLNPNAIINESLATGGVHVRPVSAALPVRAISGHQPAY
jgi:hypothetical protein